MGRVVDWSMAVEDHLHGIIRDRKCGEMAERFKAPVSKTGMGATSSWVRIPLSPPVLSVK